MKRSIKAATLTFFVTSLLAGCSSAGPAPVAQEITVSPESKVTTKDKSFTLETNASSATWSLEEDHCQAVLSATEGKSVTVSAGTVGKVTVVASASGYTTPKVTLTFDPQVQEITASSTEVYLDESISLTTNLSSANWALEDNNIGAVLSAQSGKSVSVSAASAGTVKAVATAQDSTTASLVLKFDALLPQKLSASPESAEVFKGKTISVSTSISSANWSLSENTCGAVFTTSTTGKTVEVKADAVGTVVLTSKLAHYEDASITLSFVDPHWTDDEKAQMSAALHGEVLPYPQGAGDIYSGLDGGVFYAFSGDAIKASVLSDYAKNFSSEEGWVKVPVYASQPEVELYYIFEKEIKVEIEGVEERRFAHVEFLSLNPSSGSIVENGIFYLEANDPYVYSKDEVTALFTDAKKDLGIESELDVPVLSAHHYSFFVPSSNKYASSSWYEVELGEAESAVELYKSTLEATEDYDIYADSVEGGYVAEEKNGAFSIILVGNGVDGVDVTLKKGRHYVSEWPSNEVAAVVASYESETVVPAFEDAARYSFEELTGSSDEKILAVYCHGIDESAGEFAGYDALLEGWTLFGKFNFGTEAAPEYYFLADSPDGKIGLQFTFAGGTLSIYVASNTFEHEFPGDVFEYAKMIYGIESEYEVPALPAGGYYPFAEWEEYQGEQIFSAGVECYLVENPEGDEDGGYGKILAEAGWLVSEANDVYDSTGKYQYSWYAADSPDKAFSIQWLYYAEDGVARIFFSEETYFYYEWPAELIEEWTFDITYNSNCIPEIEADHYALDSTYGIFACYGVEVSEEAPDAGYSALLEKAGFTLMGEGEEEGLKYWKANSPEDTYMGIFEIPAYGIAYWVEGDVLYVKYMQYAWLEEYEEFPADQVAAHYLAGGLEDVVVPEYKIASEDGYFEISRDYEDDGMLIVFANASTLEELKDFEGSLLGNGWNLVPPEEEEVERAEEEEEAYSAVYQYGETLAYIQVYDYSSEGYITLVFAYESPLLEEFPADQVSAFFAENEISVPEANLGSYEIAAEDGGFEVDDSYASFGYFDVYAVGSTGAEMRDYKDELVSLGWVVVGESNGDYTLQYGSTDAYVDLLNYEDDGYINISFYVDDSGSVTPVEGMTPEEIADEMGGMFEVSAGEEEDDPGVYSFYACFDSSLEGNTVEGICGYIDDCFSNLFDEFELEGGAWGTDKYGDPMCYYVSEAGVVCEIYVYEDTVYVDEDGYIVEQGTEGATAVAVVAVEFYSYYDAE